MLRSLYSAVSGVKAHTTYLDVTGNNIANVNTVGFKRDIIQFRDMIYQNQKGASAPDQSVPIGGINPAQVGLGVKVGSIETAHTQGSLQSTGVPTDMAIQGGGFFVVKSSNNQLYTRAGNFALDRDGNLVMSGNGYQVQGYEFREQVNPTTGNSERVEQSSLSTINIPIGEKIPAKATTLAAFRCNLCSTETAAVPDINNVPGGATKVARPHDYVAVGATAVNYVAEADAGGNPVTGYGTTSYGNGQNWIDPTTAPPTLRVYNGTTWVVTPPDPSTYYYGPDSRTAATGVYNNFYFNGATTGVVASLGGAITVDGTADSTGGPPPTTPPVVPGGATAGQKYLDTQTGVIRTVDAAGTAWDTTTVQTLANDTAYYVTVGAAAPVLYVKNKTGALETPANATIMNSADHRLYTWGGSAWTVQPYAVSNFRPSELSTTSQATITAFGESMIKSNNHDTKMTVYDSKGNPYTLVTAFRKVVDVPANTANAVGAESEWDWYSYYADADGKILPQYGQGAGTLVFGDDGVLKRTYYFAPTPPYPDPNATAAGTAAQYNWSIVEKIIDKNDPKYNSSVHDGLVTGKVVADFNVAGAEGSANPGGNPPYNSNMITLDFLSSDWGKLIGVNKEPIDGVTNFGSSTTTKGVFQDGYAMGELNNYSVGGDGIITGTYTNGKVLSIARVAIAMFSNDGGLTKVGETCFAESINSGTAQVGKPMEGGSGSIEGTTIEMSNVDLTEEFVNLIRAQRGFQANTRVVTTSDQVLEELINMKR
ncbi:MAG: flagellar hook-basal body complex protein [Synergistaceae bacterium]|jgi:flagellar hook protein FlgE|nr:flagellar hook-basal body complex protein [Synergistaceae bacterium]